MTRFVLIRHASVAGLGVRLNGRKPGIHLNEQGRAEAAQLASRLGRVRCDALYASPMERTQETAEAIADACGIPYVTEPGLNEIDYGDWTSKTFPELDRSPDWHLYNSSRHGAAIPGGESMPALRQRIAEVAERLRARHTGVVLLVTHADCIRALVAHYVGASLDVFQRFQVLPSSVSVLSVFDQDAELVRWNDTGPIELAL